MNYKKYMYYRNIKSKNGFTIIELLVVIVVISILASISIVAYNNIVQRTQDNKRYSDAKAIIKLIELYRVESPNGWPPQYVGAGSTNVSLEGVLTPTYVSSLPQDPKYPYSYVGYLDNYAIAIFNEQLGRTCKISSGNTSAWFSDAPECVF